MDRFKETKVLTKVFRSVAIAFGVYVLAAVFVATWVYFDSLESALSRDREAGLVRLSEATSRLRGQLDVYRALVNVIARNPEIAAAYDPAADIDVTVGLSLLKLTYGAQEIDLVDPASLVINSSSTIRTGQKYQRSLIQAALNGRLGYAINIVGGQRLIRFSRRVKNADGLAVGVVVVSASLSELEFEWPVTPEPIVFFDTEGLSVSANRSSLLFYSIANDPEEAKFPLHNGRQMAGTTIWEFIPAEIAPFEAQIMEADIPQLQMTAQILLDTANARATALLRTGLATALMVALALVGAIIVLQRRRLASESRHSATLEHRVEERTAELRAAQAKLVEAANLAALGRLSAGISHELNQPLAAILNFAENGRRLIEKSRHSDASHNLSLISDQTRRINRIIDNLRAFAKQEQTPTDKVDLVEITRHALDIKANDIALAGVTTTFELPDKPLPVMAGKVRLEQVILNLLSNALDSMQESDKRELTVKLLDSDGEAILAIRDTGTGIAEPERVFEPFYTTKELGSSKGLGMGLALAFGMVSRFGGQLSCSNHAEGAEFTMKLPILTDAK